MSPPAAIQSVISGAEVLRLKRMRRLSSSTGAVSAVTALAASPATGDGEADPEDVTEADLRVGVAGDKPGELAYYSTSQSPGPITLAPQGWTQADLEHATIG